MVDVNRGNGGSRDDTFVTTTTATTTTRDISAAAASLANTESIHLDLDLTGDIYDNFINAIKTETTKHNYIFALKKYMRYQKVSRMDELITSDVKLIEARIISYIIHLKNVEKIGFGTINGYLAAIVFFYAVQDVNLNRKKICRYLPEQQKAVEDGGYNTDEIAKMIECSDNRVRALILLLSVAF